MLKKNYLLRYACGSYWIIKISRGNEPYTAPIITNETGCYIWNCLKENHTAHQTAAFLAELYQIPYQEALRDTNEFIQLLKRNGCIEIN